MFKNGVDTVEILKEAQFGLPLIGLL